MEPEASPVADADDGGRCLCGRDSTEGSVEDEALALQIECDICHIWYHVRCVGLGPMGANAIDKYHCPRCESMCGASLMKLRTNSHRHDCTDPDARTKATQVGTPDFIEELRRRSFPDALDNDIVANVGANQLTLPYLNQTGFRNPVLVEEVDGLGISIPDPDFTFPDVPHAVGPSFPIDVIDVHTQDTRVMSVSDFISHFDIPLEQRATNDVFNCLSLEVSDSALGDLIEPPAVARKLCWVNNVWPHSPGPWDSMKPPQVQKYCIMSMKDSFTDFHIDFGGTSVWYHIFKGEKIFYFIQPTANNLSLYERWQRLSSQTETFLGDMVDRCFRLRVRQGQTVLIPTGWIHAVFTPKDSLVFGGNFLHSLNIQLQLRCFEIEDRIRTPKKFRFPSFEAVNWLAAQKLKNDLSDLNSDSTLCPSHLLGGIKALSQTLKGWLQNLDSRDHYNLTFLLKISVPAKKLHSIDPRPCPASIDPHKLVRDLCKEVRLAERISNRCNPPKPERESKRKKQKKELNEDFVDITQGNAFFFLGGRTPAKRKPPAATPKSSQNKVDVKAAAVKAEKMEPLFDPPLEAVTTPPVKIPPKKRAAKFGVDKGPSPKQLKLTLPLKPEVSFGGLPEPPTSASAYDLTDQDSVRQLLGNERHTMRQLNNALNDALAGFDDDEDDDVMKDEEEENGQDLIIDESPRNKRKGAYSRSSPIKLKLNVAKSDAKIKTSSRLEDLKMTKAHQDDDYIYPSLDLSDDEMEIGPKVALQAKDDAWNPKVRVKNVAGKSEPRPTRDKKKVTAVEMGLKLAAERRRTKKVASPKKKVSALTQKKTLMTQLSHHSIADSPLMTSLVGRSPYLSTTPVASRLSVTPSAKIASKFTSPASASLASIKKSKKGMLTAKQRIAKTLGLKF